MGAYLKSPVTTKETETDENGTMAFAATAMQGWRNGMEDAHIARLNLEPNVHIFGVFDGHGGKEVA
jgi:serine/threonine protein phosphatase PrpC